jgi:hypothetical protein
MNYEPNGLSVSGSFDDSMQVNDPTGASAGPGAQQYFFVNFTLAGTANYSLEVTQNPGTLMGILDAHLYSGPNPPSVFDVFDPIKKSGTLSAGSYSFYFDQADGLGSTLGRPLGASDSFATRTFFTVDMDPVVAWTAGNGNFATADNWWDDRQLQHRVPTENDKARFDSAGTYTVSIGGNPQTKRLEVSGGDVTFDMDGSGYHVIRTMHVSGRLTLQNGTLSGGTEALLGLFMLVPAVAGALSTGLKSSQVARSNWNRAHSCQRRRSASMGARHWRVAEQSMGTSCTKAPSTSTSLASTCSSTGI